MLDVQKRGGSYDHAADFWGLGAVLFAPWHEQCALMQSSDWPAMPQGDQSLEVQNKDIMSLAK